MNRTKPILRWPGGKSRMLAKLMPLIPKHVCYVEPFSGGAAVLLAKERSKVEILNDINGELVALYRNVQFHLPELLREIDYLHASRKNFHDYVAQPGLTEIQRAVRFLYRNRISFGGNMHSFGVAKTSGGGVAFDHNKNTAILGAAHERLNGVVIENLPYDRCMRLYDSPDTFFFVDPPYLEAKVEAYKGWHREDLVQFKRSLVKLQGRWVVTLDGSEFNRELFKDCKIETVTTRNRLVNSRTHSKQTFDEIIITPK